MIVRGRGSVKRVAAGVLVLAAFAGCGFRSTETKIVRRDGHDFLCSYTRNHISGNTSEQQCVRVPDDRDGGQ